MSGARWRALGRLAIGAPDPAPTKTTTQGLSKLDLELARNLAVLEDLELLEHFEALELMPLLDEDDDE